MFTLSFYLGCKNRQNKWETELKTIFATKFKQFVVTISKTTGFFVFLHFKTQKNGNIK